MVARKELYGTVSLMMLLTFLAGCHYLKGLEFSWQSCKLDEFDPQEPPREAILSTTWVSEKIFIVEGYLKANCLATIKGDYEVSGDDLVLLYRVELSGPPAL